MSRGDFGVTSYGATASYHRSQAARDKDRFNSLCDDISGKIFLINKNVSNLESLSKSIDNTFNETENEKKVHQFSRETNKLANETKELFKQISDYTRVGRYDRNDPKQTQYNLLQTKLSKEFQNSLSRYHAIQNVLSLKLKANIAQEVSFTQDTSHVEQLIALEDEDDSRRKIEQDEQQQQQKQLLMEQEVEQMKERQARLQQIEEDMLNVNEIFRDLALLVHEQGEAIDSIESHVEHAAIHVEQGNQQLIRAKAYQKSARKRLCIIAVIAILAAIILGVIIYYASK